MNAIGEIHTISKVNEVHVEWKIQNFILFQKEKYEDWSPVFHFCGASWILRIYKNVGISGCIELYLRMLESETAEISLYLKLGIKVAYNRECVKVEVMHVFADKCRIQGSSNFLTELEMLNKRLTLSNPNEVTFICRLKTVAPHFARGHPIPSRSESDHPVVAMTPHLPACGLVMPQSRWKGEVRVPRNCTPFQFLAMDAIGEIRTVSEVNQVCVGWKIEDFLLFQKEKYEGRSPVFHFCGASWNLQIYKTAGSSGQIKLYLRMLESEASQMDLRLTFGIQILNDTEGKTVDYYRQGVWVQCEEKYIFADKSRVHGSSDFLTNSELLSRRIEVSNLNAVNFACFLRRETPQAVKGVETPVKEKNYADGRGKEILPQSKGIDKVLLDYKELLQSGVGSDVVLKVKGKEFRCHSIILRSRSSVFASMFTHDMSEKATGVVDIVDCDPDTFQDFLQYVYTGRVDAFSAKNVYSLYSDAEKYDVQELKEECLEYMKSSLSVETFCDIMVLSLRYEEKELIKLATNFFSKNLSGILETAEWLKFLEDNPKDANELFIASLVPGKK